MKNLQARAKIARRTAQVACLGILLSSVTFAEARGGFQHGGSHPAPAPHSQPQSHPQGHPQSGGHAAQPPHAPQQGGYPHYPSQAASRRTASPDSQKVIRQTHPLSVASRGGSELKRKAS